MKQVESIKWENITYSWKWGQLRKVDPTGGVYIMNATIGNRFIQSTEKVSGYARNVYKVEQGDRIKFNFKPCLKQSYAYYIVGANDMILYAGEQPSSGVFVDEELDIPIGAEAFVFNYHISTGQTVYICRNRNNSLIQDAANKEGELLGMSERKNLATTQPIDSLRDKLLTLAWISDTHDDERNYRRFIEYVDAHAGIIDGILHTGDMNRMSDTDKGFENTVLKFRSKLPFLPVMGNHDSHGNKVKDNHEILSSGSIEWQANKYVVPFMDEHCVRDENDCYFYRDFDDFKIRIICINEYDKPRFISSNYWKSASESEIEQAYNNGTVIEWNEKTPENNFSNGDILHYKGLYIKCIGTTASSRRFFGNGEYNGTYVAWSRGVTDGRYLQQEQVDFLINALTDSKLTDEWGVVIVTHQVLEGWDGKADSIASTNWHDERSNYIVSTSYLQNGYILSDIIGSYIGRTVLKNKTYSALKKGTNTPLKGTLLDLSERNNFFPDVTIDNADFSKAKGRIICCLNGHTHNSGCYWLNHCIDSNGVKHRVLNINQETGCYRPDRPGWQTSIKDKYYRLNVSDVIRGGTLAQDCFNIISFDTKNHVVQLLRIGADITDRHVKRDYTRINYRNI